MRERSSIIWLKLVVYTSCWRKEQYNMAKAGGVYILLHYERKEQYNMAKAGGVYILLHYERKQQYNMATAEKLKTKRVRGGMEWSTCVLCTDKKSEFHMSLICPEMQSWRERSF
jgi:hypothetical protein